MIQTHTNTWDKRREMQNSIFKMFENVFVTEWHFNASPWNALCCFFGFINSNMKDQVNFGLQQWARADLHWLAKVNYMCLFLMHIQWHPTGSLKLVTLEAVTPQKLANARHQSTNATRVLFFSFLFLLYKKVVIQLLNIYQPNLVPSQKYSLSLHHLSFCFSSTFLN